MHISLVHLRAFQLKWRNSMWMLSICMSILISRIFLGGKPGFIQETVYLFHTSKHANYFSCLLEKMMYSL